MKKKILCSLLALVLLMALSPVAYADGDTVSVKTVDEFDSALNNSSASVISIDGNFTVNKFMKIPEGRVVTLSGSGTITFDGYYYYLQNEGTLTIDGPTLIFKDTANPGIDNWSCLVMNSGSIVAYRDAVRLYYTGSFTMYGGSIIQDPNHSGGTGVALNSNSGDVFNMNGGSITGFKIGITINNRNSPNECTVSDKAKVYNNNIDIYNRGTLTLGSCGAVGQVLNCGHKINGWYGYDINSSWNCPNIFEKVDEGTCTRELYIKAAHGEDIAYPEDDNPGGSPDDNTGSDAPIPAPSTTTESISNPYAVPVTGDSSNMPLWSALFILFAAAAMLTRKKKA